MKEKKTVLRVAAPKPRNILALLVRQRAASSHRPRKREGDKERKDLLQRLREAGL